MNALTARYEATFPDKVATMTELLERLAHNDPAAPAALHRFAHNLVGSGGSYGWLSLSEAALAVQEATGTELERAGRSLFAALERAVSLSCGEVP